MMTKLRVSLAGLVVLSVLALMPRPASAYDGYLNALGNLRGFGVSGSLYGLGYLPVPPYFAVHPPVYYGQRYFRTYGESPYARPARAARPLNVSVQLVTNPFVEQLPPVTPELPSGDLETAKEKTVAVQPKMIINPYYKADDEVVQK